MACTWDLPGGPPPQQTESLPQAASFRSRVGINKSSSIGAHPDHQQENPTTNENSCCSRFFLQAIAAWIIWIFTCGFCNCFPCAPSQQSVEAAPENTSFDDMPPLEGDPEEGSLLSEQVPKDSSSTSLSEQAPENVPSPTLPEPEEAQKACFPPSPTANFFDADAYRYALDKLMDALMERDEDAIMRDPQAAENCSSTAYELIPNLIMGQVLSVSSDVDTLIIQKALHLARFEQLKAM